MLLVGGDLLRTSIHKYYVACVPVAHLITAQCPAHQQSINRTQQLVAYHAHRPLTNQCRGHQSTHTYTHTPLPATESKPSVLLPRPAHSYVSPAHISPSAKRNACKMFVLAIGSNLFVICFFLRKELTKVRMKSNILSAPLRLQVNVLVGVDHEVEGSSPPPLPSAINIASGPIAARRKQLPTPPHKKN